MPTLWPGRGGPAIDYISGPPSADFRLKKTRNIVILGSTGSIGANSLDVADRCRGQLQVVALAAGKNINRLREQALAFRPPFLAVLNEEYATALRALLPSRYNPEILHGPEGYARLASLPEADMVVCAQVGHAGLSGALAAALAGKVLALANKESLVLAGCLLRHICARSGASILPLDSEHFALFQCVAGREQNVARLVLTASGGPFRGKSRAQLATISREDALRHPNWQMGAKITIDSATLMNKGLEFIEALHLYGIAPENLDILVHPQSIVHSLAVLADNSMLAQLAVPDMRLPIGACLTWPYGEQSFVRTLDLADVGALTFEKPDMENFPCLGLAMRAAASSARDNSAINPVCVILNAANEAAVDLFLQGQCGFCEIAELVRKALDAPQLKMEFPPIQPANPDPRAEAAHMARMIGELDHKTRQFVQSAGNPAGAA